MAVISIVVIPIVGFAKIFLTYYFKDPNFLGYSFLQRIIKLTKPSEDWKTSIDRYKSSESLTNQNQQEQNEMKEDISRKDIRKDGINNPAFIGSQI